MKREEIKEFERKYRQLQEDNKLLLEELERKNEILASDYSGVSHYNEFPLLLIGSFIGCVVTFIVIASMGGL